jgi:hypothetical protein
MSAAAIAAPPDAGAADTSFEADLASAVSGAVESVPLEQPAAPAKAEGEQPPGEAPTQPPPSPEPESPPPPGEAPSGIAYPLTEDGKAYLVPKTEMGTLTGLKQYADTVQNRFPTANDAEAAYLASSDFRAIQADFLSGDVEHVLNFFAGKDHTDPNASAQYRQSFMRMAEKMPEVLKGVDTQAYSRLQDGFIQARIEAGYQHAAETGTAEDLLAAQRLDWDITGQYKTELPKHDPAKVEQDRMAQRAKEVEQRETALMDRDWKSFNQNSLEGPKWQQFHAEIDKVLAPIKAKYDPIVFDSVKERIAKATIDKLQSDFEWARTHENERKSLQAGYQQLWKEQKPSDGLKPRIQAYTTDFMARVRRQLPAIAAPLLSKATASQNAVAQPQPKPASPQTPVPRAPNGQFQSPKPQEGRYDIFSDPEFTSAFKVS